MILFTPEVEMVAIKKFEDKQGRTFASVYRDNDQGMLMNVFSRHISDPQDIERVLNFSFEQIKRRKLRCWLSDISQLDTILEKPMEAARKSFSKKLEGCLIKQFAFISHRDETQDRKKIINLLSHHGIKVKTFSSFTKAVDWLVVPKLEEAIWDEAQVLTF